MNVIVARLSHKTKRTDLHVIHSSAKKVFQRVKRVELVDLLKQDTTGVAVRNTFIGVIAPCFDNNSRSHGVCVNATPTTGTNAIDRARGRNW